MHKTRLVIPIFIICSLFFCLVSQAEETADCSKCKGLGRIVDRKAKTLAKFFDAGLVPDADSIYMDYPESYGTGYKACPNCMKGKEWQKKLNERKARCEEFVKERNAVMEKIFKGKPPMRKVYHAKTEHFRMTYNCRKRNGMGMICDDVTVGWVLIQWCEKTYRLFEHFVGVEEPKKGEKKEELQFFDDQPRCFYLWASTDSQKKAAQGLAGTYNEVSFVYSPFFCTMVENEFSEHTDHYIVHHAMQLLVDGLEPWQDRTRPEWLINGVGNWAEWELFSECNIAAIGEGMTRWDIAIPDFGWPAIVYKMVKAKKAVPFSELANLTIKELTADRRVQSFGLVDYFFTKFGGKKLRKWLIRYKETKNQFQALKEVFELSPQELDDDWEEWVLENYKKYKQRNWE